MKKFAFIFKNKPVRAHVKDDDSVALYFDNTVWLFLQGTNHPEKYAVDEGNFLPGKEDLLLLGKLISKGISDYEKLHYFPIIFDNQFIKIEKNTTGHYYLQFPGAAGTVMIALNKTKGEWYQPQFDQPLQAIEGLQQIGALILQKEKQLSGTISAEH